MQSARRRLTLTVSALAFAAILPTATPAAVFVWNGGVDLYTNPLAWSPIGVPGGGDDAQILASGSIVEVFGGVNEAAGTLELGAGNQLQLNTNSYFHIDQNSVTNNGTISIADASRFYSGSGTVTFGGTGTITLDNSVNYAQLGYGGFAFGSGQTVQGSGQVGVNNSIISNAGLISGNVNTAGLTLDIDPSGGNGGVGAGNGVGTNGAAGLYNTGIIQATNGGTTRMLDGLYENGPGGVIRAIDGGTLALGNDSRILNGTLTSDAASTITAASGGTSYLQNVTLSGGSRLSVTNNTFVGLTGTLTNNGAITISDASRIFSENNATTTLAGTGTITLDNSSNYAQLGYGGFIVGPNQTVQGTGQFGVNNAIITNNGLISANVNSPTLGLYLDANAGNGGVGAGNGVGTNGNSSLYNTAVIQATNHGVLTIGDGLYENSAGGVIQAIDGGTVALAADARILNGTLTSDATSAITAASSGYDYLQNVTLSTGSRLSVTNNTYVGLNGTLTNNGAITIADASRIFSENNATTTLAGTGTITLDNSTNYAQLGYGGFIVGAGQTIQGTGQFGVNNSIITNNGLISANVNSPTLGLYLDANAGNGGVGAGNGVGMNGNSSLYNTAVIQATNHGVLTIGAGLYENSAGGVIRAINSGTVALAADARILNGTLTSDATSSIVANNDGYDYLQNVTLSSGSRLTDTGGTYIGINGSITNNGVITVSNSSRLFNEGGAPVTYMGTGTITLDDTTSSAQITGNGGVITFGAGQTVHGSGQVGTNTSIIVNNGLISSDVAGRNLDLDVTAGNGGVGAGNGVGTGLNSGLLNNAIIQADGSTLTIEGGLYENSAGGVIQAINGGTVALAADARILNGTLTSDATSSIVANNDGYDYLQNVTLSSGSRLTDTGGTYIGINGSITNNGTITVSDSSRLFNEGGAPVTYMGTGTITLDDTTSSAQITGNGGVITFGAGQTVHGSGQVGLNQSIIVNNGLISSDVAGRNLDLDVTAGTGGVGAGNGVGTGLNSGLLNNAIIQANRSTLTIEGGLYENSAGGVIQAINGGTVALAADARILNGTLTSDATSAIVANNDGYDYLQNVTLSSGSRLTDTGGTYIGINGSITNNGTITVSDSSKLFNEGGAPVTYMGTGTITLDDTTSYAQISGNGGVITFGAGQTVHGSGQVGLNQSIIVNNGLISGDVSGRNLDIDPTAGNGGVGAGNGVGTGGNTAFYNTGTVQAANGGTTTLEGGLYQNSLPGTFAATGPGSTFTMASDSSLYNLQAGGVLNQGTYSSTTTGAASTVNLRSNAADSIVTIGSDTGATTVVLNGVNSALNVIGFSSGVSTSIDSSLTSVSSNGNLYLLNNRSMTIVAGGGAFSNAGLVGLGGGTFSAASFNNSGILEGNGTVAVDIVNTGSVNATSGTLATQTISGPTGAVSSGGLSTLDLSAASANSTADNLTNNGHLVLGSHNVTVTSDYTNANFGSGNAFNRRANVSGTGDIYGVSYTVDLSGPAVSGNTINVGNVRTGGSSSTTLTITNNGTATNIVGAVQNTNAPDIVVSKPDFTAAHGGGSATTTLSYTGTHAGSLAGETITVVNNFANVGPKTLAVEGNVYQIAIAGSQPTSVTLGASRVNGTAQSSTLTIANVAPNTNGYTEALTSTATTSSPFRVNGGASATASNIAAGGSAPITVSLGTGTAGAFNNAVAISNTSIPVAGSGFSDFALAGQSVAVSGNVYAPAVANLSSTTVAFGPVRQGSTSPMQSLTLTNVSVGSLSDSLLSSAGAQPAGVTATTPGALAQGQQGAVVFALNTANAGQLSGTGSLNFTSHDSQLSDLALPSQTVDFTGTVTQLAQTLVTKNSGVGVLTGSGNTYTLNLGSFASGSGVESSILGITNNIPNSTFAEFLNGAFTASSARGFSFNGQSFTGLAGGSNAGGDLLSFNTTGASAGAYTDVLTFNGYSSYPGLSNYNLGPVTVDVTVQVTGGVAGVPEPAAWAMMLVGFGLIGGTIRRQRTATTMRRAAA